jgi:hypothetical protein
MELEAGSREHTLQHCIEGEETMNENEHFVAGEGEVFTNEHALKLLASVKKKLSDALLGLDGHHPHFRPICYSKGAIMTLERHLRGEKMVFSIMDLEGPGPFKEDGK